jgi:hypothetical protein
MRGSVECEPGASERSARRSARGPYVHACTHTYILTPFIPLGQFDTIHTSYIYLVT